MKTVQRRALLGAVRAALRRSPVVLLVGPRQCGKTTLARSAELGTRRTHFDLEDPATPLLPEVARQVLAPLRGLVVIDEFQRRPALFELLRVLSDRRPLPARFLILGSASPELVRGASETLAGRVAQIEMSGFDLEEAGADSQRRLWMRGGFPRSFLAATEAASLAWRRDFMQTFLERDVPALGITVPAPALRRFWTMLAHLHGSVWNAAELARAVGTGEKAVRHHLDILTGAFMVRQLPPWFENVGKRLVKSPKVYVRDSGLLHALLGVGRFDDLLAHPKLGFSWEGMALDQVLRITRGERDGYFYATHGGAELDLLLVRGARRFGFEFKHHDGPTPTRSMHVALADLRLDHLFIVHPGERSLALGDRLSSLALRDFPEVARERRLV